MHLLQVTARRFLVLALLCACLGPAAATAAERTLTADFDGDGQHDRVVVDGREPSLLHVWLSTTNTTASLRSSTPVFRIVATDLDGDRRPELIANDAHHGLHVWTRKKRGFHSYRPHRANPGSLSTPTHRRVDDGPTNEEPALSAASVPAIALVLSAEPRGPTHGPLPFIAHSASLPPAPVSAPSAPRPPPAPLA
jgi:hypothetical protein